MNTAFTARDASADAGEPAPPGGSGESRWIAARRVHRSAHERFRARVEKLEQLSTRISSLRFVAFATALVGLPVGLTHRDRAVVWAGSLGVAVFLGALIWHARVLARQADAIVRRDIHQRSLDRTTREWTRFATPEATLPGDHDYASDLDLVGPGSLLQRLDTTHTVWGERALLASLSGPVPLDQIAGRQEAVAELGEKSTLREDLEAAALGPRAGGKLSGEKFFELVKQPGFIVGWRRVAAVALPLVTLSVLGGRAIGLLGSSLWWLLVAPQFVLVALCWPSVARRFDRFDARRPHLEAFADMLMVLEKSSFTTPLLRRLRVQLDVDGHPPSHHLHRLALWAGWADLRLQVLLHPPINLLFMWDWHVLWAIERWNRVAGARVELWLQTLGDIEALAALSVLYALDDTCFPEIVPAPQGLTAIDLAHPLITQEERVANNVRVVGPSAVLIVTGSNMAGKSTLLRAVGLNVALALAGGPVCARRMSVPGLRLRSSMRASDSLQSGASYFYAELARLKAVVRDAGASPPIFFLFDELLRGTNAEARKTGAIAVVLHLLTQRAMGLVATHDDALIGLHEGRDVFVSNVHMTDVVVDGQMTFDYRLRQGRATTSNALRLLELAGIPLPALAGRSS